MTYVNMTEHEARAQRTFTALMWALSHPGRARVLPAAGAGAFVAVAEALIDLETSYFASEPELDRALARSGARRRGPADAFYQFYPVLDAAHLAALGDAPVGTYTYPDRSATLVIGARLDLGTALRLTGPGIVQPIDLLVGGLPVEFWSLRAQAIRYPLGWDVFLIDGDRVVGLPRTTSLEVR